MFWPKWIRLVPRKIDAHYQTCAHSSGQYNLLTLGTPLCFSVFFFPLLLFLQLKNRIGKIVRLDSGEDENVGSEAKSVGRDKRIVGIFPALFSFLFFFFFFSTSWKNEAANWIQITPFFSSIYHPYTLSLLLDQPIVVWNSRDSTSNRIQIFSFSPRSYLHIFFSVWKCSLIARIFLILFKIGRKEDPLWIFLKS